MEDAIYDTLERARKAIKRAAVISWLAFWRIPSLELGRRVKFSDIWRHDDGISKRDTDIIKHDSEIRYKDKQAHRNSTTAR